MTLFSNEALVAVEQGWRASSNIIRILKEEYIKGSTNSRIHHFLPECIAFNQSALRYFLPECIASRTTRRWHAISCGFQWERFNGCYVLLWFACKKMWRRSCLTFITLAFVLNVICESLQIQTINCDILVLNLICNFLAAVLPVLGMILTWSVIVVTEACRII